jgi:hypothetical protein
VSLVFLLAFLRWVSSSILPLPFSHLASFRCNQASAVFVLGWSLLCSYVLLFHPAPDYFLWAIHCFHFWGRIFSFRFSFHRYWSFALNSSIYTEKQKKITTDNTGNCDLQTQKSALNLKVNYTNRHRTCSTADTSFEVQSYSHGHLVPACVDKSMKTTFTESDEMWTEELNIVNYYAYWSICQCNRSSDWNINRTPLQCESGGSANNCATIFCHASTNIKGLYIWGRSADVFNTAALCWSVFAAVLYVSKITYPSVNTLWKTRRFGKGSKCNKYRAIPFITFGRDIWKQARWS